MKLIVSYFRLWFLIGALSVVTASAAPNAIQVLAGDAAAGYPFMRAVHVGGNWGFNLSNVGDGTQVPEEYFQFLDSLQVNWVGISQSLHVTDSMDSNPRLALSGYSVNSFPDSVLRNLIRTFRLRGYKVYLTLAIEDKDSQAAAKPVGRWDFGSPVLPSWDTIHKPENWPWSLTHPQHATFVHDFYANYTAAAVQTARIAEEAGASLFSLGTETNALFRTRPGKGYAGTNYSDNYLTELTAMVGAVRGVFSGLVTYDWHYSDQVYYEPNNTVMWQDLGLDVIGISAYYELSKQYLTTPMSVVETKKAWRQIFDNVLKPLKAANPSRPIVFTEFGYDATVETVTSANFAEPAVTRAFDGTGAGMDDGEVTQRNAYDGLMAVMEENTGTLTGLFGWEYGVATNAQYSAALEKFCPRGKATELVLRDYYTRWSGKARVLNAPVILNQTASATDGSHVPEDGFVGAPYFYKIRTQYEPTYYTVDGLPAWASLDHYLGVISGTPTATGEHSVRLRAYNSAGMSEKITTLVIRPAAQNITIRVDPSSLLNEGPVVTMTADTPQGSSFQWSKDNQIIAGATGRSLSIATANPPTATTYTVTVNDAGGLIINNSVWTSDTWRAPGARMATASLRPQPQYFGYLYGFTLQPFSQWVQAGGRVTFAVDTLTPASAFQWSKDGVAIAGATSRTLTLDNVQGSQAGNYRAHATTSAGAYDSFEATLTVISGVPPLAPVVVTLPAAQTVDAGEAVVLTTEGVGTAPLSYQWRKNGNAIPGATLAALVLNSAQATDAGDYSVSISNSIGAATSAVAHVSVTTGATLPNFVWRNPVPVGGSLFGVVYGKNKFVTTGMGGRVLTSADGATWTQTATLATIGCNGLSYSDTLGLFATVGYSGDIFTSPDAIIWTKRTWTNPTYASLQTIAAGGGAFVAIASNGMFVTSTDGVSWTAHNAPVSGYIRAVAGTAGKFVAVGDNGMIVTSSDAAIWTQIAPPSGYAATSLLSVAYLNNRFIIVGANGAVLTSADGSAWTATATNTSYWLGALSFANGVYCAMASPNFMLRSTDLATWSLATINTNSQFNCIAAGIGLLVTVGYGGEIWTSSDGATWTSHGATGGLLKFNDVDYINSQFVAVGTSGSIYTSSNGAGWTRQTSSTTNSLEALAYGGGLYVVATANGDFLTSPDAVFWSRRTTGDTVANYGVDFGNGRFVSVGANGKVRTSPDGIAWTSVNAGIAATLRSVVAFGSGYVAVGDSGKIYTSPDGTTWTERSSGTTQQLVTVRAIEGRLFAIGGGLTLLTSIDSIAWSAVAQPGAGYNLRDIIKLSDGYYLTSDQGVLVRSSDLNSWTLVGRLANQEVLEAMATGGGKLVIVGGGGSILQSTLVATSAPSQAPHILAQSPSQTIATGGSVTLAVAVTGSGALSYQWRKDGAAINGATGATLTISNAQSSDAGSYVVVVTNSAGSATSTAGTLTVALSRLINLSILTSLVAADDAFTMGFVVGGSSLKPLVIRAVGPSLAPFGVSNTLADPMLELFTGTVKTGENDNWDGSAAVANAMAAVGAFAYLGPTSHDAAAALSVASGSNSVRVSATDHGTGAVLAEIYDATPSGSFNSSSPRLINVSVLKQVGTGFTVGFVVGGTGTKGVLVRAIGPTLGSVFGVPGAVVDPQLTLYSDQTPIATNDNWGGGAALTSAFSSVGAFALSAASRDAAVVASLTPGSYTVQVSGVNGATGLILVEIYELP